MKYERQSGLYVPGDASEQLVNPHNEELPSVVLYGGGVFGIGYKAGVLDELGDRGVNLRGAYMLGTSAGSWVAAMVETGVQFDDVAGKEQIKLRHYERDYLYGYAREIFGDARADNVHASAFRLPSRENKRPGLEILNGGEHDLARIATASSTVPGIWAPATVEGKRYLDGAVGGSGGYADRAPRSHTLLAVNALAQHLKFPLGPLKFPIGWGLEAKAGHEVRKWQKQHGGETIYIRPNKEISDLATDFKSIFDFRLAEEVYGRARNQIADLLENEQEDPKLIELQRKLGALVARYEPDEPMAA